VQPEPIRSDSSLPLPQLILYYALAIVSVGLFSVSATTLWWMLHAWHSRKHWRPRVFGAEALARPGRSRCAARRHEQAVLGDTIHALARLDHRTTR